MAKYNNKVVPSTGNDKNKVINEALKKEAQPTNQEDLSAIHNTHATGTSGGDQRANDKDPKQGAKPGKPVITTLENDNAKPVSTKKSTSQ